MQRKANAVWKGGLKDGKGAVSSSSGVLNNTPYSFATRFENTPGTNPEELIAAAHAGCFSMALSGQLGAANLTASSIETTATLKKAMRFMPRDYLNPCARGGPAGAASSAFV